MIVDTSALIAVILGEPDAERVLSLMSGAAELGVSAATLVEAGIVAEAKGGRESCGSAARRTADLVTRCAARKDRVSGNSARNVHE